MILTTLVLFVLVPALIYGLILFLLSSVTITFCDTGDHDAGYISGRFYPDEPLFDGQGVWSR